MLDSAGEFGWQLERAGLCGDGVVVPIIGSSFSSFDPSWQVRKAPGLRESPTSEGTLQEKQRKCCNELNLSTEKGAQRQCDSSNTNTKWSSMYPPTEHFLPPSAYINVFICTQIFPTLLPPLLGVISGVLDWAGPLLWELQRLQTPWSPAPVEGVLQSYSPCWETKTQVKNMQDCTLKSIQFELVP